MSGSLIRLGVCALGDVRHGHRNMIRALVDDAGGHATSGGKPKVRAYPGQEASDILLALQHAAQGDVTPATAEYFTRFSPVIAAGIAALIKQGKVPCLLFDTYSVDQKPDDDAENRPVQFQRADGTVVRELYHGQAPS